MEQVVNKQVDLDLVGVESNAFNVMAQFQQKAKNEGWDQEEIEAVLDEAQSGDYNHLLATIQNHCK